MVRRCYRLNLLAFQLQVLLFVERFYLVLWEEEEEGTVSVHKESKLKEPEPEKRVVGEICSVIFGGRTQKCHTGKIAYVGMLVRSYV